MGTLVKGEDLRDASRGGSTHMWRDGDLCSGLYSVVYLFSSFGCFFGKHGHRTLAKGEDLGSYSYINTHMWRDGEQVCSWI